MKKKPLGLSFLLGCVVTGLSTFQTTSASPIQYPVTRKGDVVENHHGTQVADPYRWLEDSDSDETRAWIQSQNRLTATVLDKSATKARIQKRLTQLWNYEKFSAPTKKGGKYFTSRNNGLQNQAVLYVSDTADGPSRVLLDPNQLTADGTAALSSYSVSPNATYLAYGISYAGSDWIEWKVRDIETGKDLPDHVKWSKFSGTSWLKDESGFFYSRFDEPKPGEPENLNVYQKLYFHSLGTAQSEDQLVFHRPDQKEWMFFGEVSEDGRYLVITISRSTVDEYLVLYQDLSLTNGPIVELVSEFEAEYMPLGNVGKKFYFKNTLGSPRGRIIEIDLDRPSKENWKVIVPEANEPMNSAILLDDQIFVHYLKEARSRVVAYSLKGKMIREVQLPGIGSAYGFTGEKGDRETYYSFSGFTTPNSVYRYDLDTGKSTLFKRSKVDFNPDHYETKQVFYKSKDGTRVPMFITHKKGLKLDSSNPVYLTGYGGFNNSLTPAFGTSRLAWMEMGGVLAVPNLRGGGEYGEDWHRAGMRERKQNVFDDFIAAAEWLIANKYTSAKRLAITGGSNGGLLVAACMNQRPDLFGAVVPSVGVLDMLRYHLFTIGYHWMDEYGDPGNADDFKFLYAYSPLHTIREGAAYPPTLIMTADHDDRVVPAHSFKFASALQAKASPESGPLLIRIETSAGHGAGKPTAKVIEEAATVLSFLADTFGMK